MQYLDTLLPKFIDVIGEIGCSLVTYDIDSVINGNGEDEGNTGKKVRYVLSKNTPGSVKVPLDGLKNVRYRRKENEAFGKWIKVDEGQSDVMLEVNQSDKRIIKMIPDENGNMLLNSSNRLIVASPTDKIFLRLSENFRKELLFNSDKRIWGQFTIDTLPDTFPPNETYPEGRALEEGDCVGVLDTTSGEEIISFYIWDAQSSSWLANGLAIGVRIKEDMQDEEVYWEIIPWADNEINSMLKKHSDLYYELNPETVSELYTMFQDVPDMSLHLAPVLSIKLLNMKEFPVKFDSLEIELIQNNFYGEIEIEGELIDGTNLSTKISDNEYLNTMSIGEEIVPLTLKDLCKNNQSISSSSDINATNVTDATGAFYNCYNLSHLGNLKDLKVSIDLSSLKSLNKNNIVSFFNSIGTVNEGQDIMLDETMYNSLTVNDIKIASGKGWNVWDGTLVDRDGLRDLGWSEKDISEHNDVVKKFHLWGKDEISLHLVPQEDKDLVGKVSLKNNLRNVSKYSPVFDSDSETDMSAPREYLPEGPRPVSYFSRSIVALPLFETYNVTRMNKMFYDCVYLTSIPRINTSNVSTMVGMFEGCYSLVYVPDLNTSSVHQMAYMFAGCVSLPSIPTLYTSSVEDMQAMFAGCQKIETIPILDTSNVTNMLAIFSGCVSLKEIPRLNADKLRSLAMAFRECTALTTLGGFEHLKCDIDLSPCSNITKQSLINVMTLADDVTPNPAIMKLGQTNLDKLTESEKQIAINKGWKLE